MSHYTVLRTQFTDIPALVKALADLGHRHVEVHEPAVHLHGFRGDRRQQTAEVIIRRRHVGLASNDIGFKRNPDGAFDAIISGYDRRKYSREWLDRLRQRYAYQAARLKLEEQGFQLAEERVTEQGQIHLVLRRLA